MNTQDTIQMHRFHELIAFSSSDIPDTLYLSEDLAERFGRELIRYAESARGERFQDSKLGSINLHE